MPGPSTSVPFVADDEDQDDEDRRAQQQQDDETFGPSGAKSGDGRSQMPSSVGVSADDDEQMLVAPKYQAPDRTALESARGKLTADSTAIKQSDYKPKWWERLLGGVAGGLSQDAEGGASVTNRRFNQAVDQQKRNVAADTEAVNAEQGRVNASGEDFERNLKSFGGQVRAQNANSLTGERAAKANKYDNAIDPNSIKQNDDGSWEGTSYGGVKQEVGAPKWAQKKAPPTPKTYEELVSASHDPQYTPEQQKAYGQSAKEIQGTEVRKFSQNAPRASEGEIQYGDWKKAFQRDNGRPPSSQEIAEYKRRTSGANDGSDAPTKTDFKNPQEATKAKDKAFDDLQQDYDLKRRRINAGDDKPEEKQRKIAELDADNTAKKKGIQNGYEQSLKQFNPNRGQAGSAARQAGRPQPAAQGPQQFKAPKSGHQLTVGDPVNVPGKGIRYVTGYVNGKVQVDDKKPAKGT